jgi:serine/threonine protein kinase
VMYEMLSDHCPFEGVSAAVVLAKILTEEPKPLVRWVKNVPPELAAVVHRALARDRAARFASVDEMLEALLSYAAKPDPTVAARHARSIPPPPSSAEPISIPVAPVPVLPADTLLSAQAMSVPGTSVAAEPSGEETRRAAPEWRRPLVQPELGWYDARPGARTRKDLDGYVAAAARRSGTTRWTRRWSTPSTR